MMAKTLLKMILGVLLLSGLFFFALQFWEKNRAKQAQLAVGQESGHAITEINVMPATQGVTIEIKDVTGSTYAISKNNRGFLVDFPDLTVNTSQRNIPLPHPMIESIEAIDAGVPGEPGAKVKVVFATKASFTPRQEGGSLYIDLEKDESIAPRTTSRAPSRSPARTSGGRSKTSKPPRKSSPKMNAQEDQFLAELGIVDGPAAPLPADNALPPPSSDIPMNSFPDAGGQDNLGGAQDLFPGDDGGPLPFENQGGGSVAMNQPLRKNFDPSQVTANLPALTKIEVVNEGGITKVRVLRGAKTKYKVFPKRNPNRIVIDLQNVVNQLPPEITGFSGTRVNKVTTRQFLSADGTISRIELYLSTPPQIDRSTIVNSKKFLEMPIL